MSQKENLTKPLPGLRISPGDWCVDCPVIRTWTNRRIDSRIFEGKREPCASIMGRYERTGRGSGLEVGEVVCNASLQAEHSARRD